MSLFLVTHHLILQLHLGIVLVDQPIFYLNPYYIFHRVFLGLIVRDYFLSMEELLEAEEILDL
jgi:hypothetical protein